MTLSNTVNQPESLAFRYEKKFFIEGISPEQLIAALKLHPACFRELYPPRYVNNIYLDSPLMEDYHSNVNGYHIRKKIRVRWYHELFRKVDHAVLEFKIKEGEVGTKEQYPFPNFMMNSKLTERDFRLLVQDSSLANSVKMRLKDLEFALLNRYKRWYFATPGEAFRATVDSGLSCWHLGKLGSRFMHNHEAHQTVILELKYGVFEDHDAHRICAALPFRITRSSKYVAGVENVYL